MSEIEHRIIPMDTQILGQALFGGGLEQSWFKKYVFNSIAESIYMETALVGKDVSKLDVRDARAAMASMLIEACNKNKFHTKNAELKPTPTEDDRLATIEYISFSATMFGLLNSSEVDMIRTSEGRTPLSTFLPKDDVLISTEPELVSKIEEWKNKGYLIGECQFAADPPNPTHLYMLTQSHLWAEQNNIQMKLLVGVDSDDFLKRRKQKPQDSRPRMLGSKRRQILQSFWMVDDSYDINPTTEDWADLEWWVNKYHKRKTDIVFVADNQEDMTKRVRRIEKAGAKVVKILHLGARVSSTTAAQASRGH